MKKKKDFKSVIILGVVDVILFLLPKLISLIASFFGLLGKIPIIGIPFSLLQKILNFVAKIGTIPFYICTAILVILLIIKIIGMIRGKMKARKLKQLSNNRSDTTVENTTVDNGTAQNLDDNSYKQDKMDFFN